MGFKIHYLLPRIQQKRWPTALPFSSSASIDWLIPQRCVFLPLRIFSAFSSLESVAIDTSEIDALSTLAAFCRIISLKGEPLLSDSKTLLEFLPVFIPLHSLFPLDKKAWETVACLGFEQCFRSLLYLW